MADQPNPTPAAGALDLAAVQAYCDAASPAPWGVGSATPGDHSERQVLVWPAYGAGAPVCRLERPGARQKDDADAEFIARARTDLPALVAAVAGRDRRIEDLIAVLDKAMPYVPGPQYAPGFGAKTFVCQVCNGTGETAPHNVQHAADCVFMLARRALAGRGDDA